MRIGNGTRATPDSTAADPESKARARQARAAARLPWQGKAERADIACLLLLACSGYYYLGLTAVKAWLIGHHPVLLELLSGSTSAVITGGAFARVGRADLAWVVLAGIVGTMVFDPVSWWAGRRWGPRAMAMFTGRHRATGRTAGRVQRLTARYGWLAVLLAYFLPVPVMVIFIAVGWSGMSLRRFLLLDVIGTATWIATLVGLGWELGQRAVDLAGAVSHYSLYVTIALVVLVIANQLRHGIRDRRHGPAGVSNADIAQDAGAKLHPDLRAGVEDAVRDV